LSEFITCFTRAAHILLLDFNHPNNIWCQRPIHLLVQQQSVSSMAKISAIANLQENDGKEESQVDATVTIYCCI